MSDAPISAEAEETPKRKTTEVILEPEAFSQYLLHSANEILFVLRSMVKDGSRITVYFNEGKDFLLTTVIAVDEEGLVLDYGSSAEMNRRAEQAKKLFCVASHDRVRVQFLLRGVRQVDFEGSPAFRADLPDTLLRLQRREYYRLTTPVARPLKCQVPLSWADGSQDALEINVVDISGGGLAVMAPPEGIAFEPGMEFPNCRVELPEVGIIAATLIVRNLFDITLRSGMVVKRAGCQFIDLPGPMLTLIQRYIIRVERERKARESGLG